MKRVGITGQAGFIGTHLANYVEERDDTMLVPFEDAFFEDEKKLRDFVKSCDVIIHLAAATRMPSEDALYNLNVGLVLCLGFTCMELSEFLCGLVVFHKGIAHCNGCPEDG